MNKEKIEELSLVAYPIAPNIYEDDGNIYMRRAYSEALTKAASILFTEDDIRESYLEGSRVTFNYSSGNITPEEFDKSEDNYINSLIKIKENKDANN